MMIIRYQTLSASSLDELRDKTNEYMDKWNYSLVGGVVVDRYLFGVRYLQTICMVVEDGETVQKF